MPTLRAYLRLSDRRAELKELKVSDLSLLFVICMCDKCTISVLTKLTPQSRWWIFKLERLGETGLSIILYLRKMGVACPYQRRSSFMPTFSFTPTLTTPILSQIPPPLKLNSINSVHPFRPIIPSSQYPPSRVLPRSSSAENQILYLASTNSPVMPAPIPRICPAKPARL